MLYAISIWNGRNDRNHYTSIVITSIESIEVDWDDKSFVVRTSSGTRYAGWPFMEGSPIRPNDEEYDFEQEVIEILGMWEDYWKDQPEILHWMEGGSS